MNFILDRASIELFFDQGETVMTEIFFTNAPTLLIRAEKEVTISRFKKPHPITYLRIFFLQKATSNYVIYLYINSKKCNSVFIK
jgi:hypothetical protein